MDYSACGHMMVPYYGKQQTNVIGRSSQQAFIQHTQNPAVHGQFHPTRPHHNQNPQSHNHNFSPANGPYHNFSHSQAQNPNLRATQNHPNVTNIRNQSGDIPESQGDLLPYYEDEDFRRTWEEVYRRTYAEELCRQEQPPPHKVKSSRSVRFALERNQEYSPRVANETIHPSQRNNDSQPDQSLGCERQQDKSEEGGSEADEDCPLRFRQVVCMGESCKCRVCEEPDDDPCEVAKKGCDPCDCYGICITCYQDPCTCNTCLCDPPPTCLKRKADGELIYRPCKKPCCMPKPCCKPCRKPACCEPESKKPKCCKPCRKPACCESKCCTCAECKPCCTCENCCDL